MRATIDTILFGGSAGSLTALKAILPGLAPDLPASVLICQHQSALSETGYHDLLSPYCRLRVETATEGMALRHGQAILAAPDTHLMMGGEHVHLRRGAHENNFRPAIDPLFRSAAVYRATRAVAVVLSGLLDDGAAGARALARTGGRVIVQDPATAEYPDMPRAAIEAVPDAQVVPLDAIAGRLTDLAGTPAEAADGIPWQIGLEMKIAALEGASMENERKLGSLSPFNCPHCDGVLWEIEDGPLLRYRCHTGHGYTAQSLIRAQEEALDAQLFKTLRAHRGRAELLRRMALRAKGDDRHMMERRAGLVEEDFARLEAIIRQRGVPPHSDDANGAPRPD